MRILAIHERAISLQGNIANAVVDFARHKVSLVAVVSDQQLGGRPIIGYAFNSIGRFAQSGLLRERMIPRVLAADPATLLYPDERSIDPAAVARAAMQDEKPGGHGDRSGAVAALELAVWDLNAKLADEPACEHIAKRLQRPARRDGMPVYAAGGYYHDGHSLPALRDELRRYQDQGYDACKIKIGGAPLAQDLARVAAAIDVTGASSRVAVDANGRFDRDSALRCAQALAPLALRWYEEPGDPLDYALLAAVADAYPHPIATGENLFSTIDAGNLTRYGGLRPAQDVLQMDPGLSYGLTAYLDTLSAVEAAGFDRSQCVPHGGHLINLHINTALGLGGCEAYPGVFQPFGGYAPQCRIENGRVWPSDAPGWGLEQKAELAPHLQALGGDR
jgi:L-alanine-DL-glutamate epimerase-like enolase superfamily enzyme